ncbi:putative leucine-rich repeat-containing protein DDB_G0290503 [Aplysia californica]|uniref:Leucine-rich repeat-containing protein DDB_G0290503 n=1 Tax=Aplysia californica TaxID=6500 RepID=A0ABM1AAZ5_APLCA|nr:putative leucine-rich repeat-containing protein DDB_G0290503 [Aplysia californica]XP_012944250.1 putative leucine-rich repeat-containing protein DDB_G0290503 [Aplysia californica]
MEESAKLTDENDNSECFSRYTPQHPLPEELKKLARDDTVCKYCGVSYLIHNEIKALEDKLKATEKELAVLRGQEQREELLKQENAVLKQQVDEFRTTVQGNNKLISSLNSEIETLKGNVKEATEAGEGYKKKYMNCLRQLSSLSQTVRQQRQSLTDMRTHLDEGRREVVDCLRSAKDQVVLIKEKSSIEIQDLESKIQCIDMEKLVLSQSNKSLTDTVRSRELELEKKSLELQQKEEELEKQRHSLGQLEKNLSDVDKLSESLQAAQGALKDTKKQLEDSTIKCRALTVELDQYKMQMRNKTSEINDLSNKQKQQEQSHEVALQKVHLELQSKENELAVSLKQLKTWENKWREQQQKENDILQQSKLSQNETQDLKDHLRQAKADVDALKAEREMMIEAHQNRIEDLRESFKNKMAEMENWPQKLQAAVAAEKTRHLAEVKTLEENLKHNFVLELQIEKDKYNELLKKVQSQERDKNSMRDGELALMEQKHKQELEQLQRQMTEARTRAQEREADLSAEVTSLKKIIKDLQDRFARLDGEDNGKVTELQAKLADAQQELGEAQTRVTTLEDKVKEATEQAQFLQNIVRKECEERFELTEALSEARKELLELKKPPGGYSGMSKRGSVSSLQSNQSPAPLSGPEDPLLKLRSQMPTNNVKLSYSGGEPGSRNHSSSSSISDKGNEAKILESRKRIANMMGRRS